MINALVDLGITAVGQSYTHATVGANVQRHVNLTSLVTRNDN